jgi:methyltransferase (TIGR00027 family)
MQRNKASFTAQHMAQIRAAHQVLDTPLVLNDPVAVTLAGLDGMAAIRAGGIRFDSLVQRTLRAFAVARSYVVEDELELAITRGIRQFVILGAGLDTFAYRNPYANQDLKVFEVNHPDTQIMKRERLAAMAITPPKELTFVPVNFEIDRLDERLHAAGFDSAQPALFSWLGVSMYLPVKAVRFIFQYVKTTAPGSSIVFDYMAPLASTHFSTRVRLRVLACLLALKGEPWRTFFDPAELTEILKSTGYRRMDDMDWHAINARFFDTRTDGLRVGGPGHIMVART